MDTMTSQQRLNYLASKRKWLQEKGMDLRPNRLKEMIDLMSAGLTVQTETDDENTTT